MISIDDAIALADSNFPRGPEKVAQQLNARIKKSALVGCDGWCLSHGDRIVIRINSARTPNSQRFTLAHELAHLLLGIPSLVGESVADMLSSSSAEERRVNRLAAELLLPKRVVAQSVSSTPVVARVIEALAKKANISQLAAVLRICNVATDIGLDNAAVAHFQQDGLKWIWSDTLEVPPESMPMYLASARAAHPMPFRRQQSDGRVAVASLLANPKFESSTLFMQLLPADKANSLSPHERRQQLENLLFKSNTDFRNSLQGCFGAFRPKVKGMSLEQAISEFWQRYQDRFAETPLNSDMGREYVTLRLAEWQE